jgi:hypothetical protein
MPRIIVLKFKKDQLYRSEAIDGKDDGKHIP